MSLHGNRNTYQKVNTAYGHSGRQTDKQRFISFWLSMIGNIYDELVKSKSLYNKDLSV